MADEMNDNRPNAWACARFRRRSVFDLEIWIWESRDAGPHPPPLRFIGAAISALHTAMGGHPEVASGLVVTNEPILASENGGILHTLTIRPNTPESDRAERVFKAAWPILVSQLGEILGDFGQISENSDEIVAVWGPESAEPPIPGNTAIELAVTMRLPIVSE